MPMSVLANLRRRTLARCLASTHPILPPSYAAPVRQPYPYIPQRCLSDGKPRDEPPLLRRIKNDVAPPPYEELDLDGFAISLIETAEEEFDTSNAFAVKGAWKAPNFPVSPLMDPKFLAARQQNQIPKALPGNEPTLFQRRLALNPYAIALATPVRLCQLTRTPLPSYFLQDMQLAMHPGTGNPVYVPRGSFLEKIKLKSQVQTEVPIRRLWEEGLGDEEPNSTILSQDRNLPKYLTSEDKQGKRIGPSIYTLASKALLASMNDKKAGFGSIPHARLLSQRILRRPKVSKAFFDGHFRPDMHDFVLEMARRRLFEILANLDSQKRQVYLSGFDNWKAALGVSSSRKVVFLWTKPVKNQEKVEAPGEFATVWNGKTRVPLHNLEMLLGKEKLEELRKHKGDGEPSLFNKPIVKIKSKNMTLGLQMRLWWLQCYLAEHKNMHR